MQAYFKSNSHMILVLIVLLHPIFFAAFGRCEGRTIDFSAPSTEREVNQHYSLYTHGRTQKFFVLNDERIAAVMTLDPKSPDFAPAIDILVYSADEQLERINASVNNLGSDALQSDVAMPVRRITVSPRHIHVAKSGPIEHQVGRGGDEYDRYSVTLSVDGFTDGDVTVRGSSSKADVFVQTKDLKKELSPP
jgi:hypothetical protein